MRQLLFTYAKSRFSHNEAHISLQGLTTPEQYMEKLNYSVEFIQKKQDTIADKMAKMQGNV